MRDAARAELAAQLALLCTPGVRPRDALLLVRRHGSALAALAGVKALRGERAHDALHSPEVRERVRRALDAIAREGIRVIVHADEAYPARLRERLGDDAPPVLFALGDVELLDCTSVAVVGTRRPTEYGLDVSAEIAEAVALAGGCVVSGLALGIDAAAHTAALEVDGATVAVLGCGVDVVYPRDNMQLQQRLAGEGLLLSEFLPGEPPRQFHFPHRNRIIAALSNVVVVVEAGRKSGAVRTADHAVRLDVPVQCVMNAMHAPTFEGVLDLVRDGAPVFIGTQDLLLQAGLLRLGEEAPPAPGQAPPPADPLQALLWQELERGSLHVDALAVAAGEQTRDVLGALLQLELDGRIEQRPGQRFARVRPRRKPKVPA